MDKKVECMAILLVAVIASAATSYVTTLSLNQNNQKSLSTLSPFQTASPSPQPTQQPPSSPTHSPSPQLSVTPEVTQQPMVKIFPITYDVSFDPGTSPPSGTVCIYSNYPIYNLTVVYKYIPTSEYARQLQVPNGTLLSQATTYGDYIPSWGPVAIVENGTIPYSILKIPDDIMMVCSRSHRDEYRGGYLWDVYPQLNVTEVYGYS